MKKLAILGLTGLLLGSCSSQPLEQPREDEIKQRTEFMTFSGLIPRYELQFKDRNKDGDIDRVIGFSSAVASGDFLAYDSTVPFNKAFGEYAYEFKHSMIITPELDSAITQLLLAAQEFTWEYEQAKYNQKKESEK